MRHIQIKILAIIVTLLISVSSYGQMQQVLKNGFVAATDDGVWYLQDGFSEWVNIGSPIFGEYNMDSVFSISCNNYNTVFHSYATDLGGIFDNSIYAGYIFGDKLTIPAGDFNGVSVYVSETRGGITNKLKYIDSWAAYYKGSVAGYIKINYRRSMSNNPSISEDFDVNYKYLTSLCSDNDSIICFVGSENKMYKPIFNFGVNPLSVTSISGLHSRPTDSHQICYNPDDDEFIIVSDSGIVYSYDKTTVTTLDTLSNCDKVYDIAYGGGYVYILTGQSNSTSTKTFISSDLLSFNEAVTISDPTNVTLAISYSPKLDKILILYGYDGTGSAQLVDNVGNVQNTISLSGLNVFDLDYINYMP